MRPGGGRLAPAKQALAARLEAVQGALNGAGLLAPLDVDGWRDWLPVAEGPAAGLLRMLKSEGWSGSGVSPVALLHQLDEAELEQCLVSDQQGTFVAQPEWKGSARETGPLARRMAEPVVQETIAEFGCGLAARFTAQCVETARCLEEMRGLAGSICDEVGMPAATGNGSGLGLVGAARGWLAHRVQIENGRIQSYQVLAPTEWNFHPRGVLARSLRGLLDPQPERLARLMVTVLDPCVPWRLEIR